MLRKLGCGVASLAIIVPSAVSALSVEDYTLNSYLSQPLDLQIKLADLKGLNENDIRISLATPEEFEAAGIEFDMLHNSINFDVDVAADGTGVVRVTTKQPLSEPFISFLVEYKWPSGRLMREYNLLLDPPSYRSSEPPKVTAAKPVAESKPTASRAQKPPVSTPPSRTSAQPSMRASGQEHRVSSSDTLWDIAAKNRPDSSISVQQMMVAIQELNPDAFINGNINLVKEGAVLRLPNADDVRNVTTRDAMAEVAVQNRQWQQLLESRGLTAAATAKPLDGKDIADSEVEPRPGEGAADTGRVTLVAAEDSSSEASEKSAAGSDDVAMGEDVSRLQRQNSELAERLQDLEEQLNLSEQLLTLRSKQIAELEQKLRELNEAAADELDDEFLAAVEKLEQEQKALEDAEPAPVTLVDADASDAAEGVEAGAAEIIEARDVDAAQDVDAAEEGEAVSEEAEPSSDSDTAKEISVADAEAKETAAQQEEKPDEPKPVAPPVAPEPYEEPSFFGMLMENTMLVFGLLALLVLALLLVGVRIFKGRKDQQEALVVVEDGSEEDDDFADPFHFGDADEPSVDELAAEAQNLLENEQYEAAVPVLRDAINQDPSRTELRKNLLFALHKTNGAAYQQEVIAVRGTSDDVDAYIAELEVDGSYDSTDDDLSLDDLEDDLKLTGATTTLAMEDAQEHEEDELDFDFGETISDEDFSFDVDEPLAEDATGEEESLLDDFDFSFDEKSETESIENIDSSDDFSFEIDGETELDAFELDSDVDLSAEIDAPVSEESLADDEATAVAEDEELPTLALDEEEFSLDGLSLEDMPESLEEDAVEDSSKLEELDLSELSGEAEDSSEFEELDLSELSGEGEEPLLESEEEFFSFEGAALEEELVEEGDFDLSALTVEDEVPQEPSVEQHEASGISLEANREEVEADVASGDDQVDSLLAELESFDEPLDEVDLSSELEKELEQLNQGASQPQANDALTEPEALIAEPAAQAEQEFLDPEAEGDPVDTRLNLARAFLDMGDEDIARETLMEVIAEGNEEQKSTAQAMLDELES